MIFSILVLILAALMVVLGFIALLKQKTYLDANTGQTTVDVPFAGKMTTNVPALAFVFLGFALAIYDGRKGSAPASPATWTLRGSFAAPQRSNFSWSTGWVELVPTKTHVKLSNNGAFEVTTELEADKFITDAVDELDYTHDLGSSQIDLQQEVQNFDARTNSLIESLDRKTRTIIFKPVSVTFFDQSTN
ncbi:exported hypothetical protein [Verrucomicrobia bacterium]|nr:exported hypothetical protein [Verrucomicrobiota bacterium]